MMGLDNPIHLAFLLVILLMVFGAKRLPEMGRSLGSGLRGFKESVTGSEPVSAISATPEHAPPAPVHAAPAAHEAHVETTAPVA
jgi:sec-independent protein translocase protein TatA